MIVARRSITTLSLIRKQLILLFNKNLNISHFRTPKVIFYSYSTDSNHNNTIEDDNVESKKETTQYIRI